MGNTICLDIPLGYTVVDKETQCTVWAAEKLLQGARRHYYDRAVRRGTNAVLYSRFVLCPDCGRAYCSSTHPTLFRRPLNWREDHRLGKEKIHDWVEMAGSLFDDGGEQMLLLSPQLELPREFACPDCGKISSCSEEKRRVTVSRRGQKVILTSRIQTMDEILALKWIRNGKPIAMPDSEQLTLDLGRGRVYINARDSEGRVMAQWDLTGEPDLMTGGAVHKALKNKDVMRTLLRMLEAVWGSPLPLQKEIPPDMPTLVAMTMFAGYDESFYNCIPYSRGTWSLDRGFRRTVKELRRAENLPGLYDRFDLPAAKSIRRAMFRKPGLFFYLREIGVLWHILADVNLLCRFLEGEQCFEVLAGIHAQPGIAHYLEDVSRERGSVFLLSSVERFWKILQDRAIEYGAMNNCMRKQMRRLWYNQKHPEFHRMPLYYYAIPMGHFDQGLTDSVVDGYLFRRLRTSNDYFRAGEALQNCLTSWRTGLPGVFGVYHDGEIVAAVEVSGRKVQQARTEHNGDIDDHLTLREVAAKWMDQNCLEWASDDDDDELLPF